MAKKVVRLTGNELHRLVKTVTKRVLNEELLMEMAYPRNEFVRMVYDKLQQIIQNWCLVRYSTLTGDNPNKSHWKTELLTHIVSVASNKIKKNNSYQNRFKATKEVWEKKECDRDVNVVGMLALPQFIEEGIDYKDVICKQVFYDCMNASSSLIQIIAAADEEAIKQYIESI